MPKTYEDFIEWLTELGKHPLFTPITFILGLIISFILGYYFYFKSSKKRSPIYSIRSRNLIRDYTNEVKKLSIKYENEDVKSLTVSRFLFWNDGAETINRTDITVAEPLIIKTASKILDVEILALNEEANRLTISLEKNEIKVDFDYLDKDNGVVLQIFHTGTSSNDLILYGKIKGSRMPKKESLYSSKMIDMTFHIIPFIGHYIAKRIKPRSHKMISFILFLLFFSLSMYQFIFATGKNIDTKGIGVIFLLYSVLYLNIFSKSPPKGLEVIYDEF